MTDSRNLIGMHLKIFWKHEKKMKHRYFSLDDELHFRKFGSKKIVIK